jgi:hypothetical protein
VLQKKEKKRILHFFAQPQVTKVPKSIFVSSTCMGGEPLSLFSNLLISDFSQLNKMGAH